MERKRVLTRRAHLVLRRNLGRVSRGVSHEIENGKAEVLLGSEDLVGQDTDLRVDRNDLGIDL
jgi:hypothetical protein